MATRKIASKDSEWAHMAAKILQAADAMTDEENDAITAAANRDPDCPIQTREQIAGMRPWPFVRELRLQLGLSQQAFAEPLNGDSLLISPHRRSPTALPNQAI
jgi:DNA-binding transcriptional regulator YiaG